MKKGIGILLLGLTSIVFAWETTITGKALSPQLSKLIVGGEVTGTYLRTGGPCSVKQEVDEGETIISIDGKKNASVTFGEKDTFRVTTYDHAARYQLTPESIVSEKSQRLPFFVSVTTRSNGFDFTLSESGKRGDMLTCQITKPTTFADLLEGEELLCITDSDPKMNSKSVLSRYRDAQIDLKGGVSGRPVVTTDDFGFGDIAVHDTHVGEFVVINFGDDGRHMLILQSNDIEALVGREERIIAGEVPRPSSG